MVLAGRYEMGGDSFSGGMAHVYVCRDLILERIVAIKVMPGDGNQRRVRDEISALLTLRSKHVVQVYDVFALAESKEDLAIVQEFIDGKDLFDATMFPESTKDYLKLIWQISSGIADIHKLGIIHRDIKPNNMKVDGEGVLKIFDFGLSRPDGDEASTVGFVGTRGFAAPELYAQHVNFTAAVDTFAFGATALYMAKRDLPAELTAQPPSFPQDNFQNNSFNLPVELVQILNACLNTDPAQRPAMAAVRDLVGKYLLADRHKALVVFGNQASYLDHSSRSVSLRLPTMGEVEISYDGLNFSVISMSGDVFVNNRRAVVGYVLPGACVVALGAPAHGNRRRYITFDLSHPEIVL